MARIWPSRSTKARSFWRTVNTDTENIILEYCRLDDRAKPWEAVITVETTATWHMIFVRSPAEHVALRMLLSPLRLANLEGDIGDLLTAARRAFRAWHNHDTDSPCRSCDPEAYRAEKARLAEVAARKAAR